MCLHVATSIRSLEIWTLIQKILFRVMIPCLRDFYVNIPVEIGQIQDKTEVKINENGVKCKYKEITFI